jgi:8-oxo-dGTP pyrophosphatase MutT (NUDIX family)
LLSDADFPQQLAARLQQPLPGEAAQRRFEPELSYGRHRGPPAADAMSAAVLLLLYHRESEWWLPLTVRTTTVATHAGQISLPGGKVDVGETSVDAALRELEEELGVSRRGIELLGELSPLYLFVSNFLVHPWVAVVDSRPAFAPNPDEVAELLEVPLSHLLDPANHSIHARRQRGVALSVPHFQWGRYRIWGATSMILGELVEVIDSMNRPGK